jgi:hypothetical protein
MTTAAAKRPPRVKCPHCTYSAEPGASIEGHVSMAHKDVSARSGDGCAGSSHIPGCAHAPAQPDAAPAVPPPSAAGAAAFDAAAQRAFAGMGVAVRTSLTPPSPEPDREPSADPAGAPWAAVRLGIEPDPLVDAYRHVRAASRLVGDLLSLEWARRELATRIADRAAEAPMG